MLFSPVKFPPPGSIDANLYTFLKKVVTMFTIDDLRPHENDLLRIKGLDFRLYIEEDDEGVPYAVWRTWKIPLQVFATPNSHEGMLLVAELSWVSRPDGNRCI